MGGTKSTINRNKEDTRNNLLDKDSRTCFKEKIQEQDAETWEDIPRNRNGKVDQQYPGTGEASLVESFVFLDLDEESASASTIVQPPVTYPVEIIRPRKRNIIKDQLLLILHAKKCKKPKTKTENETWHCPVPRCLLMKKVLEHIILTPCDSRKICRFPLCNSSRQLIYHWNDCKEKDCTLCFNLNLR